MKKIFSITILAILSLPILVFSNDHNEVFVIKKEVKHLPILNQGSTGTCWSFATTSFLESEILRMGLPETDLSEMYFVKHAYRNKVQNFLLYQGKNNLGEGGLSHDVMNIVKVHGMVPQASFPGKKIDGNYNHSKLDRTIQDKIKGINNKLKGFNYGETNFLDSLLVKEIGEIPSTVEFNGQHTTPNQITSQLHIDPKDYIELTSFSHHPFYETFVLEVPDNWSHASYFNLPIDELMDVMYNAIEKGYSICWDGDVSEKHFVHKNGKADLEEEWIGKVSQQSRQETFVNRKTTDDHLMHIVGISKDQSGRNCFYTKNSWGQDSNEHGGYLHMTEDYVQLKTVGIMIHKDALPTNIRIKLNL